MVCEECPYILPCWSGVYVRLQCSRCGRRVLNTNPGDGQAVVADVIIIHDCEHVNPQVFGLNTTCCSVCAEPTANFVWTETHEWIHEDHGLHLVLKKKNEGNG